MGLWVGDGNIRPGTGRVRPSDLEHGEGDVHPIGGHGGVHILGRGQPWGRREEEEFSPGKLLFPIEEGDVFNTSEKRSIS